MVVADKLDGCRERERQKMPLEASDYSRPTTLGQRGTVSSANQPSRGIWRQGMWLSLSVFAQSVVSIAQSLIVSRFYGPGPVMDALGACNGVIRYLTDLLGGIQRGFLQNYVLLQNVRSRADQLFWGCQVFFFTLLAFGTLGTWLFRGALLEVIYPHLPAASRSQAIMLLPLLFLGLTVTTGFQLCVSKAIAHKHGGPIAIFQVSIVAATIVATILFLPSIGLIGILLIKSAVIAISSLLLLFYLREKPVFAVSAFADLKLVARDGAWLVLVGAVGGGIVFLENRFASSLPQGRLTIISWARQFAFLIGMLLQGGLRQTLSVHFQELVRDQRKAELRKVVKSIIDYSLVVGSLVALGTVFVTQDVFAILFGNSSWKAHEISRLWQVCCIYSMLVLVACLGGLLVTILIATKSFLLCLLVETVRLGSFAVFGFCFFSWDIYGLATAQVLQQTIGTGLVLLLLCQFLERKPRWADLVRCLRVGMVLAPTAAGLWLGRILADWLVPMNFQVAGAWARLSVMALITLPCLGITIWLGTGMEIAPLHQIGSAVRKRAGVRHPKPARTDLRI